MIKTSKVVSFLVFRPFLRRVSKLWAHFCFGFLSGPSIEMILALSIPNSGRPFCNVTPLRKSTNSEKFDPLLNWPTAKLGPIRKLTRSGNRPIQNWHTPKIRPTMELPRPAIPLKLTHSGVGTLSIPFRKEIACRGELPKRIRPLIMTRKLVVCLVFVAFRALRFENFEPFSDGIPIRIINLRYY